MCMCMVYLFLSNYNHMRSMATFFFYLVIFLHYYNNNIIIIQSHALQYVSSDVFIIYNYYYSL